MTCNSQEFGTTLISKAGHWGGVVVERRPYNFLSTFGGTHYVTPRALTGEIGFHS